MFPFTDDIVNEWFERTFDEDVAEEEMVWHRDKRERSIHVLEGKGWKIQFDNELPTELEKGKYYVIPEMDYHRVIKGEGSLILEIEEKEE